MSRHRETGWTILIILVGVVLVVGINLLINVVIK